MDAGFPLNNMKIKMGSRVSRRRSPEGRIKKYNNKKAVQLPNLGVILYRFPQFWQKTQL